MNYTVAEASDFSDAYSSRQKFNYVLIWGGLQKLGKYTAEHIAPHKVLHLLLHLREYSNGLNPIFWMYIRLLPNDYFVKFLFLEYG